MSHMIIEIEKVLKPYADEYRQAKRDLSSIQMRLNRKIGEVFDSNDVWITEEENGDIVVDLKLSDEPKVKRYYPYGKSK